MRQRLGPVSYTHLDVYKRQGHLYLTAGAAAALASSIAAVTHPGDEVVVVSPYFPEYRTWIEAAGCTIVEVPAAVPSFQPDIEALRAAIGPKLSLIHIFAGDPGCALADLLAERGHVAVHAVVAELAGIGDVYKRQRSSSTVRPSWA